VNPNRKARLCLHTNPLEIIQVTYLAFCSPYKDRIHCHPDRNETLIPIRGEAILKFYDDSLQATKAQILNGEKPYAISTTPGVWHGIETQSESFVMVEIGSGPFSSNSTIYA
jgi:cupin fold WbuC family metalloprotein